MSTELMSVNDLGRIAKAFAMSNLFGFKNESEAFSLMCIAQANGLHPAKAAERYHIIQGRPAMKADAMLSSFQESGGKVKWIKRTDTECKLWLSHPQGGELEVAWTIERAQKAGLGNKDNWKKFPAQMLAARCVSEGVRALFPACLSGMYTPEEVSDFSKAPAVEQTEAEVIDEQAESPNAPEADEDFEAFKTAVIPLAKKSSKAFIATMQAHGYKAIEDIPKEARSAFFKALNANVELAEPRSAPTATEQTTVETEERDF